MVNTTLTPAQVREIIMSAKQGPHGVRDKALVALIAATGQDPRQLVGFRRSDLSQRRGQIFRVLRFEQKPRKVGLCPAVRKVVARAVDQVEGDGMVFPVSAKRARRILCRSFVAAGLEPRQAVRRMQEAFRMYSEIVDVSELIPPDLGLLPDLYPENEPKAPARGKSREKTKKHSIRPRRPGQGGLCG